MIKYKLLEAFRARHDLPLGHARVQLLDLQYHDVSRPRSPFYKLQDRGMVERVCTDADIETAIDVPPQTTRARLRGEFVKRAKERKRDYTVDWVHLKLNDQAQRTVLCKDPFKSRDERVERLIESALTAGAACHRFGWRRGYRDQFVSSDVHTPAPPDAGDVPPIEPAAARAGRLVVARSPGVRRLGRRRRRCAAGGVPGAHLRPRPLRGRGIVDVQHAGRPGDRVFVNKLSYRLHDPNRGDVVVLHEVSGASERDLIKRVIALPGETIEMSNCQVKIDGRTSRRAVSRSRSRDAEQLRAELRTRWWCPTTTCS